MADKLLSLVAHILEVMFFAGVIGCVLMITVSWVEIFADGFSEDHNED